MTKHGEFNWNELVTHDAQRAIDFYGSTIGWTFRAEKMPSGRTYWIALAAEEPVCGILTLKSSEANRGSDRWIAYVHVNDLDAAVAQVSDRGGVVLRAPWNVPGVGRVAMIRDPGGAELGWVTPV